MEETDRDKWEVIFALNRAIALMDKCGVNPSTHIQRVIRARDLFADEVGID